MSSSAGHLSCFFFEPRRRREPNGKLMRHSILLELTTPSYPPPHAARAPALRVKGEEIIGITHNSPPLAPVLRSRAAAEDGGGARGGGGPRGIMEKPSYGTRHCGTCTRRFSLTLLTARPGFPRSRRLALPIRSSSEGNYFPFPPLPPLNMRYGGRGRSLTKRASPSTCFITAWSQAVNM